jgi:hypothetical protein
MSREVTAQPPQPAAPQSRSLVYVVSDDPARSAILAFQRNNADGA